MSYLPPASLGLGVLGVWTSTDISALGTSDVELNNTLTAETNVALSNPMPQAGRLRALSVRLSGDVGAAGNDLVVTCYKNGVATALTVTLAGGAGTEDEAVVTVTPISYAAGDDIAVYAKEVGTCAAVRAVVIVWGTGVAGGASVGGGGGGSERDTYANLIATTPSDGTIGFPTNGFDLLQYDSGWRHWGPIYPFTAPDDSSFSWINQGGASVNTTNGGIYLLAPGGGSGANLRMRQITAPATPYTITAYLLPTFLEKSFHSYGMFFRENGTGEIHVFDVVGDSTGAGSPSTLMRSSKFSSPTAFSADYQTARVIQPIHWFQISDDGANRICRYSGNGQHWISFHSIGRTDFLTADRVGFYAAAENSAVPNLDVGVLLLSWAQT